MCNYVERNLIDRDTAESLLNKMYDSVRTFLRFSFGLDSFTDLLSGEKDVSYFLLQALFSFSSILTVIVVAQYSRLQQWCVPLPGACVTGDIGAALRLAPPAAARTAATTPLHSTHATLFCLD